MSDLVKIKKGKGKRVGRGYGSGKGGHTIGRGVKGQKSRKDLHILFEGLKVRKSFIKRIPLKRGKDKFKPANKPTLVKLDALNIFPNGSKIDQEALLSKGLINDKNIKNGVKILNSGKLDKKLIITVPISNTAIKKVEKKGGKVENN